VGLEIPMSQKFTATFTQGDNSFDIFSIAQGLGNNLLKLQKAGK
jgi:hypothetical protein